MGRSVSEDRTRCFLPWIRHVSRLALVCLILFAFVVPATPTPSLAQAAVLPVSVKTTLVSPANGQASVGDTVTFQITLTNSGSTAVDVLPLGDAFDSSYLRFTSATIGGIAAPPDLQRTNVISWTDLTLLPQVGNLAPGGSVNVLINFSALIETKAGGSLDPGTGAGLPGTQLPGTTTLPPNPNDFYDKETRFLIDYAIDQTNGGIYLAVKGNGTLWDAVPDTIYGFPPNFFVGSTKHPGGQGICIEYFIREYERLQESGRTITTQKHGVQGPADMLKWARNCADFINAHMIIGKGQNEPAVKPSCTPGDGNKCVYYWGFVNAAGNGGHRPPTGENVGNFDTPNSHHLQDSFLAWMQAELARILHQRGDPSYTTYKQASLDFLNWAKQVGAPLNTQPATPANPSFAGRDRFWTGVLMAHYELSVDEGTPNEALRTEAIDCVNQRGAYAASVNMRGRCNGGSYVTAYGRAAAHAMEVQHRNVDNYYQLNGRTTWHDFGTNRYTDDPAKPLNPTVPFAHGSGRELVAGNQRTHWFYYTFPKDPFLDAKPIPGGASAEAWSRNAILTYWKYSIDHMWDATAGQESWWDAQLAPGETDGYKPCFSLGTPLPIGDWLPPTIGEKVHTLNPDGSAIVTVSGVDDTDWPYVSWKFKGIGVSAVRVLYSTDNGANWTSLPAQGTTAGTYVATIPPQPGKTVLYYAEAEDGFGNISTFPANAPQVFQLYTLQDQTYTMAWSNGSSSIVDVKITPKVPNAVTLSYLEAKRVSDGVQLSWQTSSEENTYGFNIYRGARADRSDAVRLNSSLVPSHGAGTAYGFIDSAPDQNANLYWLEEVDLNGQRTWYRVPVAVAPAASHRVFLPFVR